MPVQFECTTCYLGKEITIKTDDFRALHQALAGVDELNRDANFLAKKTGKKKLKPNYRKDQEGNEYYGVCEKGGRRNVTFGQLREGGLIGFFPKGEDGYYDPDERNAGANAPSRPPQRNDNGQRGQKVPQPAEKGEPNDGLPF